MTLTGMVLGILMSEPQLGQITVSIDNFSLSKC
nr:MAG TPA: hypothetical protein [Caudoviricetes sp.]